MRGWRRATRAAHEVVLRRASAVQAGQVAACSVSLIAAGVLLARGFIGINPARPVFLVLGGLLVVTAFLGLALDHVEVRSVRRRPDHVLVEELHRARRFGHPLSLVGVRCADEAGWRVVERLRSSDRAWRQRGWLYVLLVETDAEGAISFGQRLEDLVPGAATRTASFPDDAVTVDGLYRALRRPATPGAAPDVVAPIALRPVPRAVNGKG